MPESRREFEPPAPGASVATTLQEVRRALSRHRTKALLVFLFTLGSATLAAFLLPKTYRSEGKLFVRLGRENATLDETVAPGQDPVVALSPSRESEINSLVDVLRSRAMVERVVEAMGPDAILRPDCESAFGAAKSLERDGAGSWSGGHAAEVPLARRRGTGAPLPDVRESSEPGRREQAVRRLESCISIEPGRKSAVIGIVCEGPSPAWTQAVVDKLIDLYLAEHIRLNRPGGSLEFFAEQLGRLESELNEKEQTLRDLKAATGIVAPVEQRESIVRRTADLEQELARAEAELAVSRAKTEQLKSHLARLPEKQVTSQTSGFGHYATDLMRSQLYDLQLKREKAAAKYTLEHPVRQQIERQLAAAHQVYAHQAPSRRQVTTATSRLHEETRALLLAEEAALASWQAKTGALESQLARARQDLETFTADELRIARFERDVELARSNYRTYAASVERARIDDALKAQRMSNLSVVQPASYEPRPVRPRKPVLMLLGLVSGLLGALGVALVAEWVDPRFHTPEDVERRLDLPVLGSIPRLRDKQLALKGNGST